MISVRNPLLQLNGSNYIVICLLSVLMLVGCGTSKSVAKQRSSSTASKQRTASRSARSRAVKVDTVKWTNTQVTKTNSEVETSNTTENAMIKKDEYNVALFVPLNTRKYEGQDLTDKETRVNGFINYYAGVKMALDQLKKEDVRLKVDVYDSETSNLSRKIKEATKNADIIIGPYNSEDVRSAAKIANQNEITLVSPWKALSKITDNPYYVQLLPSLSDHMDKLVEHAVSNYEAENVIVVGRKGNSKDKNLIKYLQSANSRFYGRSSTDLREFYVETDSLLNGETAFDEIFNPVSTTAFIVPNYRNSDDGYLRDCLRRINVEKGLNKVVVYTMPLAYNYDQINFDYYKNLNMKIARSYYVDLTDNRVQQFRRDFFNRYNATPSEDAFKGYDMMLFVGRALNNYGTQFQFHIEKDDETYLQTDFNITAKRTKGAEFEEVDHYVNKSLNILEFANNRFNRS